jgi:predicted ATPase
MQRGDCRARRLNHPSSLSLGLALGAVPLSLVGDYAALFDRADELVQLATEQAFPYWGLAGIVYRSWAAAHSGNVAEAILSLRDSSSAYRKTGAVSWVPYFIALVAEACEIDGRFEEAERLLDEALQIINRTGECWLEAELGRHKAQLLRRQGHLAVAEECYCEALRVAEEQGAKLWELRAATGLARLLLDQGRPTAARDRLTPVYAWFTEGFGTPDLNAAAALLRELGA